MTSATVETVPAPPQIDWKREGIAGATVFAVLVPSALAYSSIVGVEPTVGLIGVPLALLAYALVGGSKLIVVGADAAVSVMVASAVANVHPTDEQYLTAVLTLSLLVGAIFLIFRLFRLGWIADVIPQPVLKGFVQGLVWTTIVGQLAALLGLTVAKSSTNMFVKLWYILGDLDTIQVATAAVGITALAALLAFRHFKPSWPGALIVLVASGVVFAIGDLGARGVAAVGVPSGALFNTQFSFPDRLSDWNGLAHGALAIVILAFTEHLGCAQMVADERGETVDPNRELLGLGAANLAVGMGSSFAVTGTLSKTSVALQSGARTKWANLFTAVLALIAALTLRPMFAYLASAVLAAVVIWAMLGMIDIGYFRWLREVGPWEFAVAVVAFIGVMLLGVMPSVILATVLSLFVLGRQISRPVMTELGQTPDHHWRESAVYADARPVDGFRVVRIGGPIVFLDARVVGQQLTNELNEIERSGEPTILIVDCAEVSSIDTTGQRELSAIVRTARKRSIEIRFCEVDHEVWAKVRRAVRTSDEPMVDRYLTVADAVAGTACDSDD